MVRFLFTLVFLMVLSSSACAESALTFDFRKAVCHEFNETNECPTAKFIVRQT